MVLTHLFRCLFHLVPLKIVIFHSYLFWLNVYQVGFHHAMPTSGVSPLNRRWSMLVSHGIPRWPSYLKISRWPRRRTGKAYDLWGPRWRCCVQLVNITTISLWFVVRRSLWLLGLCSPTYNVWGHHFVWNGEPVDVSYEVSFPSIYHTINGKIYGKIHGKLIHGWMKQWSIGEI